ncbi:Ltp family lipoprotein [Corynebacterium urogenitale]
MNTTPPNNGPHYGGQDPRWDSVNEGQFPVNGQPHPQQQPGNLQPGGPFGPQGGGYEGPGGVEQNGKKGNKGVIAAAAIGAVAILGIGAFVACQPEDEEADPAAETSQSQEATTSTQESTEASETETAEQTSSEETAESEEELDPSQGRPAGSVPYDELEDGDEITLGEGLGPGQEWGTYDGKIVRVPEPVVNPGAPSADLKLAKEYAVYYAYQDLKSKVVVTERLTDTSARVMQTFTPEVAQKAVDESDIDWNAIALVEAKKYKERWPDDPDERLFGVLTEQDKFTVEEAQYAIDNLNR